MKAKFLSVITLIVLLGAAPLIAREGGPGIYGTPHDISVITGEEDLEPCAMCHSPHSGSGSAPLWNRDQAPQTYIMYESPSFDMNEYKFGPQSPSTLCLACHNGVFSTLVNYPGPGSHANENYEFDMNPTFWAALDTDLSNVHPISFTYEPALDEDEDGFPHAQPSPTSPWRLWINGSWGNYPLYGTGTVSSPADQFECPTCHSVHDTALYPGKQMVDGDSVGRQVFFLRADNTESRMCTDCHINRY